jgi:hypothetical protein
MNSHQQFAAMPIGRLAQFSSHTDALLASAAWGTDFYQAMMTGVPIGTRPNRLSESGMCIRMQPWDA